MRIRMVMLGVILCYFFTGCRKDCVNRFISPVFIGFNLDDLDTFVLRVYKPNTNFMELIDSVIIVKDGSMRYSTINDSTIAYFNSGNINNEINPDFDWVIYVPAANRTFSISNIVITPSKGSAKTCYNPIDSWMQDGKFVSAKWVDSGVFYTSGYFAYLHY